MPTPGVSRSAEQLERRKWIYEQKYPETKAEVAGGKARQKQDDTTTEQSSFADDAAHSQSPTWSGLLFPEKFGNGNNGM